MNPLSSSRSESAGSDISARRRSTSFPSPVGSSSPSDLAERPGATKPTGSNGEPPSPDRARAVISPTAATFGLPSGRDAIGRPSARILSRKKPTPVAEVNTTQSKLDSFFSAPSTGDQSAGAENDSVSI